MNRANISNKGGISFGYNARRGSMLFDLIVAAILLSFIVRPVLVDEYNESGEVVSTLRWELPLEKVYACVEDLGGIIDRTWAGMDEDFGYTGPQMSSMAMPLVRESMHSGFSVLTAGLIDRDGMIANNLDTVVDNYEQSTYEQSTAFYDTALAGMRVQ